jgi:hypothetical protein
VNPVPLLDPLHRRGTAEAVLVALAGAAAGLLILGRALTR